jgi:uncharacterized membrane protein YhaH (DUF805 family)
VDFGQAISGGFVQYVNFRDRACRSEFWYWALFINILSIVAFVIDLMLKTDVPIAVWLVTLPTYIPPSPSACGACTMSTARAGGF